VEGPKRGKNPPLIREHVQSLLEILASVGFALVVLFAITMHSMIDGFSSKGVYYFFRAAVRTNDFLHLTPADPNLARWPNVGFAFGISTLCVGIVIFAVVRFLPDFRFYKVALGLIGGFVAFLAFPAAWLLIFGRARSSVGWTAAAIEFICGAILFLVYYWHPFAIWAMNVLMLLHYCFWTFVICRSHFSDTVYGNVPPPALLLVFPLLGIVWLLYMKVAADDVPSERPSRPSAAMRFGALIVSTIVLGALWLSGTGYSLTHAKDFDSVVLEMSRSNCQMGCPVYTVTVHGNGKVDYVGRQFVRVHGAESSFLSQDQVRTLLDGFDRADFSRLEDRAFAWGYHTSRVGVKITVDGKTKEVWSDTYHVGAKSSSQAKFVQAAATVDKVLGTDRWVKCDDSRCSP